VNVKKIYTIERVNFTASLCGRRRSAGFHPRKTSQHHKRREQVPAGYFGGDCEVVARRQFLRDEFEPKGDAAIEQQADGQAEEE